MELEQLSLYYKLALEKKIETKGEIIKKEKMACWSAENATKAYLSTLQMGHRAKEPDVAEFISALAAGNSAKLLVVACAAVSSSTVLALAAAAHQTGGSVVCILQSPEQLHSCKRMLGHDACHVKFIIGEAQTLLLKEFTEADFILIDCNLENHEGILRAVQASRKPNGAVVIGYNAFGKGSWRVNGSKTQLLPIGEGLLLTRIASKARINNGDCSGFRRRSHWVVKVDQCTGEEHVFRVRLPQRKLIEA